MGKAVLSVSGPITEPELSFTNSGLAVVKFSIANELFSRGKTESKWIVCVGFGDRWQKMIENGTIGKGTIIQVVGQPKSVSYVTRQGKSYDYIEVTMNDGLTQLLANFGKNYSGSKYQVGENHELADIEQDKFNQRSDIAASAYQAANDSSEELVAGADFTGGK